ncbi:hypothetical protein AC578_2770 [Pseudocercospora eumusae]|uniref:Uncharacterized protein n=1 Tax=Pseudocercospora eumusae TaxID=321146 RepID=A0A139HGT1_9PEZI|nr:hypothetical protein AC578_2770 [Pseudocercospora eumusae]
MTLTKYAPKYERCDGAINSIKRQMSPCASCLPPHLRLKYTACKNLCEADYNVRFRFCDLPGELRNRIYEHLLLFADHHKIKSDLPCVSFRDEGLHHDSGVFQDDISLRTRGGACWTAELLYRDHLRLVIRRGAYGLAAERLHSLFSHLRCNRTVLKTITITCSGHSFSTFLWSYASQGPLEELLWPIARFCTKFKVQFENCPAGLPGAVQALADKKRYLFQIDISVRAEIMGKLLAHDEILTTMLLHHMPQEHASYVELKTEFHSVQNSGDTEPGMKEAMDKLDDFLNAREVGVLMRRGERIVDGHSQELAQEF